jgi:hypothetical protein
MRGRYGTHERNFRYWNVTFMAKAWGRGAGLVLVVYAAWLALLGTEAYAGRMTPSITLMLFATLNVPGLAALLTALRAPRHRFLLGLSMAPLAAACAVAVNLAVNKLGLRVDLSGFYDNIGLFIASTGYGAFVAAIGGGVGAWRARRIAALARVAPVTTLPEG